jgi:hypothetical protein
MKTQNEYLTISELCTTFNISKPVERRMRQQGILKPSLQNHGVIRYRLSDLQSPIKDACK